MRQILIAAFCGALMVSGCATKSADLSAQYVSPARYSGLNCDQVREELVRISSRVREVSGLQDRRATGDAVAAGIGIIVFWPAMLFLMNDDHAAELRLLKGQYEAVEQTADAKRCPVASELAAARAGFP